MTDEKLKKANELSEQIRKLELTAWYFNPDRDKLNRPRIGSVKRKGTALYTINDNHCQPVNEVVLPRELTEIIWVEIYKYVGSLKKKLEEL